ncbi:DUF4826 domain-containing protein [Pseudoalteromonas aliena]|uniref:DUF4826 domain-containing protein n=1 Tax=Pseudoalteromonas aliena TaxID=247523 RepID=A0A1Q2H159_9GAMM|nr:MULTISPECIES: DUF4826 family protein [Pseudoalteromonas]AQQ01106.1 DUF4826 domain-containing protein [Pseudoalteromonas aliena]TMO03169.1 DUF4826 domain-containing protein [Pseudoalteromonas sp. S558]
MQQQERKQLTNEEQAFTDQQRVVWQRECFQSAQKHLAEKGIMPKSVVDKDSRFLAPLCALWKFKAQNGKAYWVVTGRLPTDHAEVSVANNARDAMRYFSMQWQLKADQIMSVGTRDKTQIDFANLLINRAHGLYEIYEKEQLWANEQKSS